MSQSGFVEGKAIYFEIGAVVRAMLHRSQAITAETLIDALDELLEDQQIIDSGRARAIELAVKMLNNYA